MIKINPKIRKYLVIALVSLGLFYFFGTSIRSCSQRNKLEKENAELLQKYQMLEVSRDSISKRYNEGLEAWEYSRSLYTASNNVLREELGKYSARLDSIKRNNPKADVGFSVDARTEIDTLWKTDTVYRDSFERPIYEYSIKDTFQEGKAVAYPDSLRLKLMTKTGLVGVIEDGRLKVTPTNKNVQITGMEGFQVKQPVVKSRFWRGFTIGIGVGAVATGAIILTR